MLYPDALLNLGFGATETEGQVSTHQTKELHSEGGGAAGDENQEDVNGEIAEDLEG